MNFESILFKNADYCKIKQTIEKQDFFTDLNLNQIIDSITSSRQEEYNIKPFFNMPLHNLEDIYYRQHIMKDLENNTALLEIIKCFAEKMHSMRVHLSLAERLQYKFNKQGWFIETVKDYCSAVSLLAQELPVIDLKSDGFLSFRKYINNYAKSEYFISLKSELESIKTRLSEIKMPANSEDLIKGLELGTIFEAMALGNKELYDMTNKFILTSFGKDLYKKIIIINCYTHKILTSFSKILNSSSPVITSPLLIFASAAAKQSA